MSGNLFTLYLAGALYHLRAFMSYLRLNPPFVENLLPLEWDDADFTDEDKKNFESMLPICKETLENNEVDDKGEPLRGREPWRLSNSLSSKLCSNEDIKRRSILANLAFQNYKKVWEQGKRIPLKTRLKIYEAQVVSVLMYNCSCWAASKQLLIKLDICHRKHLRQIIGMTYPNIIKNDTLKYTSDYIFKSSI